MQNIIESQNAKVYTFTVPSKKSVEKSTKNISEIDSETELSRNSIEKLGSRVKLTDKDETAGLELFCYIRCESTDSNLLRECRGVVFHGEDLVLRAFPYTIEFSHTDEKSVEKYLRPVIENCYAYDAYEGTLIRMFNFNGKWYISTHRKLDAFRSKWASRQSFGDLFVEALEVELQNNEQLCNAVPRGEEPLLERFQSILDPNCQYMFLVSPCKENRIVCLPPSRPTIYHVGTFMEGKLYMDKDIYISRPTKHNFSTVEDLIGYVGKIDINKQQGVIVFTEDNKQYKIVHADYKELFDARGNEPSIKYRYLQVRMDDRLVKMLCYLYPEMVESFEEYENVLYDVAKLIYNSYVERHIKKQWSVLPNEEYKVDCICNAWHVEDRKNNRVSLNKVIEVLNEQSPTSLNKMIRRFRDEKAKKQKQDESEQSAQINQSEHVVSEFHHKSTISVVIKN